MSWPAAFVLGAIVSPTDPVAATAIAGRVGIPRRDRDDRRGRGADQRRDRARRLQGRRRGRPDRHASARSRRARSSSTPGIGGAALGLAIGWVIAQVRERLDDPPVEITIALFSGYAAYLPAEELGLSGVTAAVAIGLYMGSQTSRLTNSTVRMQGDAVWQIITFLLNSFLFLLIGLQLPTILDDLRGADLDTDDLLVYGGVVTATVIVTRHRLDLRLPVLCRTSSEPGVDRPLKRAHGRDRRPGWACAAPSRSPPRSRSPPSPTPAPRFDRAPRDPVLRLLRDPRHARAAGPHAAVADPPARRRGRRQRRPRAGGARPPAGRRGGARADRRPRAGGVDARRLRRPPARHLPLPHASASPRASTTTSTTARSRTAAPPGAA